MSQNGQLLHSSANGHVFHWPQRVLSADDLRRHLNGEREVVVAANTVVTPLAAEHLRSNGITFTRQDTTSPKDSPRNDWGYAVEGPQPLITSVMQSLEREGLKLQVLPAAGDEPCAWARGLADCVARGSCRGGVAFCADPSLVCCVANKLPGLRAAVVLNVMQAARAMLTLGANLLAVEMPGRTFFEVRQIVRCLARPALCPPAVACSLGELDGHAHR